MSRTLIEIATNTHKHESEAELAEMAGEMTVLFASPQGIDWLTEALKDRGSAYWINYGDVLMTRGAGMEIDTRSLFRPGLSERIRFVVVHHPKRISLGFAIESANRWNGPREGEAYMRFLKEWGVRAFGEGKSVDLVRLVDLNSNFLYAFHILGEDEMLDLMSAEDIALAYQRIRQDLSKWAESTPKIS